MNKNEKLFKVKFYRNTIGIIEQNLKNCTYFYFKSVLYLYHSFKGNSGFWEPKYYKRILLDFILEILNFLSGDSLKPEIYHF